MMHYSLTEKQVEYLLLFYCYDLFITMNYYSEQQTNVKTFCRSYFFRVVQWKRLRITIGLC